MVDANDMLNDLITNPWAAVKSMTVSDLGDSVLTEEYFKQFVRVATRDQTIFADARRMIMTSNKVAIDRTGFAGRVMEPGVEDQAPTGSKPFFKQEHLVSEEFVASVGITDKALRRNRERDKFQSTLISMTAEQWGEDWETLAVFGDKTRFEDDDLLASQDGWVKKANNKLYGTGADKDYDAANADVCDILQAMIKKYPANYLKNRSKLRFYLNSDMFDLYLDEVGLRPTSVGDSATGNYIARPYKGIPVVEATVLNDEAGLDVDDGWGTTSMLADPDNLVYGIFHEVTMEPDRIPKNRKTDWVFSAETDQGFENADVCVVALNDLEKPDDDD